jgi:acid stress chaperone HdeA
MTMLKETLRAAAVVSVLVLGAVSMTGCSGASKGGDTTCGDYKKMSSSDQKAVITAFFAEKGESNPSNGKIFLSQQSARLYCATAGNDSSPIRSIDG